LAGPADQTRCPGEASVTVAECFVVSFCSLKKKGRKKGTFKFLQFEYFVDGTIKLNAQEPY
jgi:hypothetical protein